MDFPLPALLIALPLAVAVITLAIGRWSRIATGLGVATALGIAMLSLVAWRGEGPVVASWIVAGRAFELTPFIALFLGLLALSVAVLLFLHWVAPGPQSLIAGGLAALAFLAAALMVEPFAFGAVFLAAATAMAVPSLYGGRFTAAAPSWQAFLVVTLAMPMLVAAGWFLDSGQAETGMAVAILLTALLLLLGGFPFYIWISGLAREASLPAVALMLGVVAAGVAVWLAHMLDQFPVVRGSTVFQTAVLGSVAASSLIAAFGLMRATDSRGWLAYGLVFDAGLQVATLTVPMTTATAVIAAGMIGRLLVLLILVALAGWPGPKRMQPNANSSSGRRIILAYLGLSLLGLPLTPVFAARWATLSALANQSPLALGLVLLALGAAAVAGVRCALFSERPFIETSKDARVAGITAGTLLIIALFMGVIGPVLLDYLVKLVSG